MFEKTTGNRTRVLIVAIGLFGDAFIPRTDSGTRNLGLNELCWMLLCALAEFTNRVSNSALGQTTSICSIGGDPENVGVRIINDEAFIAYKSLALVSANAGRVGIN